MLFSLSNPTSLAAPRGIPSGDSLLKGDLPRQLFGFEVIDFIGEGAGSVIYAVTDPGTHQIYALKHVLVKHEKHLRYVDQLANELKVSQEISHPNVRKCIELKTIKPLLRKITEAALIMELVEGIACEDRPPAGVKAILEVFIKTAAALQAMHNSGYVHCDLKPNNILRTDSGNIKLIDLGQACPIGSVKKRIQGTPDYMAPEQVRREPMTVRTDVYNFGATLYWILTGRTLPTLYTLKKSGNSFLMADSIPSPKALNEKVPEVLSNLVMECVRPTPLRRPADMIELTRRLEIIDSMIPNEPVPSLK